MKRHLEEAEEEERLRVEREELLKRGQREIEQEANEKRKRDTMVKSPVVHTPLLTKQELAEQSLKEALERDKRKKQEEQERLDRLANKMAAHSDPDWKRTPSPPIPALASRSKVMSIGEISTSVTNVPTSITNVPTNVPTIVPTSVPSSILPNVPPTNIPTNVPTSVTTIVSTSIPSNISSNVPPTNVPKSDRALVSPEVQILPHPSQQPHNASHGKASDDAVSHRVLENLSNLKTRLKRYQLPSERSTATKTTIATGPTVANRPIIARPSNRIAPRDVVDEFNSIKYNRPSQSRLQYWSDHPQIPRTNTSLEMQQTALLNHQKDKLDKTLGMVQYCTPPVTVSIRKEEVGGPTN